MLTPAPLPQWLNLFRALLFRPHSNVDLAAPWRHEGEIAGWLSRSAWSLALIAQWRQRYASETAPTVWIPDYFCNASLFALRRSGVKIVFYPVSAELAPDDNSCRKLAEASPPDIFLLVHYFGRPNTAELARDFCIKYNAWLIEDAAHVLRPVTGVGDHGDFVLYSPHKHLPIPDGAVLVVRANGPVGVGTDVLDSFGSPDTWPGQLRELQQRLGCSPRSSRTQALVWLVKRVLQKLGVRALRRSTPPFAEPLNPGSVVCPQLSSPFPSNLALHLIAGLTSDLGGVAQQRLERQLLWDVLLRSDESCANLISLTDRPDHWEWTPYLAVYNVDPDVAEDTYRHWQRNGLLVTTWPDLPPEVSAHKERHVNAWRLRHGRLYLPVHQSLSTDLMKRLKV